MISKLLDFWNLILVSNTFNFVVLVVILAIVFQKINLTGMLEKIKEDIVSVIENSKKARSGAELNLSDAKNKVSNLANEVKERLELANKQAFNVSETIKNATEKRIKQINDNVDKVAEAEAKTLYTKLSDETVAAAVDLAQKRITDALKNNPQLHNKYIDESIEELEKVVF